MILQASFAIRDPRNCKPLITCEKILSSGNSNQSQWKRPRNPRCPANMLRRQVIRDKEGFASLRCDPAHSSTRHRSSTPTTTEWKVERNDAKLRCLAKQSFEQS